MEYKELQKHFKNTIIAAGDDESLLVKYVPVDIPVLDGILTGGKGLPKGRTIILFGHEGSGKTFLAQQFAKAVQKQGGTVLLIDAERCYDAEWWVKTGVDISKLIVTKPLTGEMALDIAEFAVQNIDCVIVDSFASLLPTAEFENNMGQIHIAPQARMINKGLRKITAVNEHCIFVIIQQTREKMVPFGNPITLPGGKGQMFHASIMLQLKRGAWITDADERIGMEIKVITAKNKLYPPWLACVIPMLFDGTVDYTHMLLEYALANEMIVQKGPYYKWQDVTLLGKKAMTDHVKEHIQELRDEIDRHKATLATSASN